MGEIEREGVRAAGLGIHVIRARTKTSLDGHRGHAAAMVCLTNVCPEAW